MNDNVPYEPLQPEASTRPVPSLSPPTRLTQGQRAIFETNGYLVIPNALDERTVALLLKEANSLLEDFALEEHPMTKFTTGQQGSSDHVGNDYFLTSGDKIRFFFEEDAFDAQGQLTKPKHLAVNKFGHYLHVLSLPFASILSPTSTHSPGAIVRSLGFRTPLCLQSMIICKQPEIGGAVPPHQDSTFLYTDPPSAVGFWYALEDATRENGCLSFWKGSHRWKGLGKRFVRKADGSGTEFVENEGRRFPRKLHEVVGNAEVDNEVESGMEEAEREQEEYTTEEVSAGTLVLIHGNLLHKSERNTSLRRRLVYTFHVIEGEGVVYDDRNWLQPPHGGFTKI